MRGQVKVYQRKIVEKRRRRAFYRTLYTFVVIGFIWSALSSISHLDSITINQVVLRGNERLSQEEVELVVKNRLVGNYLGFFSRANAFLYPQDSIEEVVRSIPIVKAASIARSGFNTVTVSVAERTEVARWCAEDEMTGLPKEPCYSMDEYGFVFAPALKGCGSNFCAPPSFIYSHGDPDMGRPLGKQVFTPDDFKKISFFMHEVDGLLVGPESASVSEYSDRMAIELKGGGKIIIDIRDDLTATLQNMSAIFKDKAVVTSLPEFLAALDYIKFDAGNKVVYKLKAGKEKVVK
jgi:hypothetical protein